MRGVCDFFPHEVTAFLFKQEDCKLATLFGYSLLRASKKRGAYVDEFYSRFLYKKFNLSEPHFFSVYDFLESKENFEVVVVEGAFFSTEIFNKMRTKAGKLFIITYTNDWFFQDIDYGYFVSVEKDLLQRALIFVLKDFYDLFNSQKALSFKVRVYNEGGESFRLGDLMLGEEEEEFFDEVKGDVEDNIEDEVLRDVYLWIVKGEEEKKFSPLLESVRAYACVKHALSREEFDSRCLPFLKVERHPEREDVFFATFQGRSCRMRERVGWVWERYMLEKECVNFIRKFKKQNEGICPTFECVVQFLMFISNKSEKEVVEFLNELAKQDKIRFEVYKDFYLLDVKE